MSVNQAEFELRGFPLAQQYIKQWKSTGKLPTRLMTMPEEHKTHFAYIQDALLYLLPTNPFNIVSVGEPTKEPYYIDFIYSEESEYSIIIIKPDAVNRGLEGEIIQRIINRGLTIEFIHKTLISPTVAKRHYEHLKDKPYFPRVHKSITFGASYVLKVSGEGAIEVMRNLVGDTDPLKALPGTIRGDYGTVLPHNIIHASDCQESAKKECANLLADIILPV